MYYKVVYKVNERRITVLVYANSLVQAIGTVQEDRCLKDTDLISAGLARFQPLVPEREYEIREKH